MKVANDPVVVGVVVLIAAVAASSLPFTPLLSVAFLVWGILLMFLHGISHGLWAIPWTYLALIVIYNLKEAA